MVKFIDNFIIMFNNQYDQNKLLIFQILFFKSILINFQNTSIDTQQVTQTQTRTLHNSQYKSQKSDIPSPKNPQNDTDTRHTLFNLTFFNQHRKTLVTD